MKTMKTYFSKFSRRLNYLAAKINRISKRYTYEFSSIAVNQ